MESIWRRRSVRIFLAIGFGVPWLGWGIIAITGMGPSPLRTMLFYTGDFMTVAGLVATAVAGGGRALKAMFRRCLIVGGPVWLPAVGRRDTFMVERDLAAESVSVG